MQFNKNGIKMDSPKKNKVAKRLEYALDLITFYRIVDGIRCEIVVPKFSQLRTALKEDGWRVVRNVKS